LPFRSKGHLQQLGRAQHRRNNVRLRGAHTTSATRHSSSASRDSLPRIDAATLRPGCLVTDFVSPVVLTNLAEHWPMKRGWSLSYLATVHGDAPMGVAQLPSNLFDGDVVSAEVGNSYYADHVRNAYVPLIRPIEHSTLGEYICNRFDDYAFEIDGSLCERLGADAFSGLAGLPFVLAADDLTQLTCGLGPANEGVMFHAHTAAWNALMFGEKEWLFYRPDQFSGDTYNQLAMLDSSALREASTNVPDPPMRCTQKAGEVVFVPDGWWHATFSYTDTACLGGQRHRERLPSNWGSELLQRWPRCGLALNAAAKEYTDLELFKAAFCEEPFNMRYAVELITAQSAKCQWSQAVETAKTFRSTMEQARARKLLSRVEYAAIVSQIAECLYHTVDSAANAAAVALECGSSAQQSFAEAVRISMTVRELLHEALSLDPGNIAAKRIENAIETRARAATAQRLNN